MDVEMTLSIDDLFGYLAHIAEMKELRMELESMNLNEGDEEESELADIPECDDEDDVKVAGLMYEKIIASAKKTYAVSAHITDIVNNYMKRYKIPSEYMPVISVFAQSIDHRESERLLRESLSDMR